MISIKKLFVLLYYCIITVLLYYCITVLLYVIPGAPAYKIPPRYTIFGELVLNEMLLKKMYRMLNVYAKSVSVLKIAFVLISFR